MRGIETIFSISLVNALNVWNVGELCLYMWSEITKYHFLQISQQLTIKYKNFITFSIQLSNVYPVVANNREATHN